MKGVRLHYHLFENIDIDAQICFGTTLLVIFQHWKDDRVSGRRMYINIDITIEEVLLVPT